MAHVNFGTIMEKIMRGGPGVEEEVAELSKRLRKKLCSLDDIEKHNFNIGIPPEIPKFEYSQNRQVRTGVTLKTTKIGKRSVKQVSGPAYLRVDSQGKRTFIDSENNIITHSRYYPDPAFNTETKLKTRILGMLEPWHREVLWNFDIWKDELVKWRKERELANLEGTEEFLEFLYEVPFEPLSAEGDMLTGFSTRVAVCEFLDNLLDSIALLRIHLRETEGRTPPEERLLARFDDEDDYEEPQEAAVPTPKPYQMRQFHHWCLERHAN
ncbi:hypothetical protein BJX62DRAFT_241211 [Aspergillus germanicus]